MRERFSCRAPSLSASLSLSVSLCATAPFEWSIVVDVFSAVRRFGRGFRAGPVRRTDAPAPSALGERPHEGRFDAVVDSGGGGGGGNGCGNQVQIAESEERGRVSSSCWSGAMIGWPWRDEGLLVSILGRVLKLHFRAESKFVDVMLTASEMQFELLLKTVRCA